MRIYDESGLCVFFIFFNIVHGFRDQLVGYSFVFYLNEYVIEMDREVIL